MATYTSHYNLKKPAIGETIDIGDINGNMDTLDTELYEVSQEVAKSGATYVSCSSISAVQNHLLTKYTDMEERDSVLVAIKTTFTNTYFDVNSYWEGHMYCLDKSGTGYFTATLTNYSSANQVVISYANGTWSYNSIHNVKNLISAEATARTSAINTAVAAEKSARESADASINQALAKDVFALKTGTDIPRSTDFNTLITPGNYRVRSYSDSASMTNIPIARAGTLYVKNGMLESGANYIQQIYATFENNFYVRYSENKGSSWSAWEQLALKRDVENAFRLISWTSGDLDNAPPMSAVWYTYGNASGIQNKPNTKGGVCLTPFNNSLNGFQFWYERTSGVLVDVYVRHSIDGTWTAWKKLTLT